MTGITRFTAYRRNLSERGTHTTAQANPDDVPQYEGVVFSEDGKCVIHWLTKSKSISIFDNLAQMLEIHGHPEYGTDIVWHDAAPPAEWEHMLISHAEHRQHEFHHAGMTDVTLRVERDLVGTLIGLALHIPGHDGVLEQVFPAQPS